MTPSKMHSITDNNKYQVFLLRSRAHFPFIFADHVWLVTNKKGEISRWEITYPKNCDCKLHWGHLHKNFFSPFQGIHVFSFYKKLHWPSKILHYIEGDENSVASRMADFIENSPKNYPYCYKYSLFGPNCGTYVKWVLDHFPEFNYKLKNYIGSRYRK